MKKETKEMMSEFQEMFNISESSDNSSSDLDLDNSFDALSEDVSNSIESLDSKGKKLDSIESSKKEDSDFDKIDSVDIIGLSKSSEVEEEQSEQLEPLGLPEKKKIQIEDGIIKWFLESPTPVYDMFYQSKSDFIRDCTSGGQLPFDVFAKELAQANVDMSSEVFDNVYYINQMSEIQQWMQRVKNIQLKCNNQYFLWDRFIELLRGCLARVEYLKPSIKQDGLIHEHMRDVEMYFCKLQDLYDSCRGVMKTLEKAFDALSRKATITSITKSGDKYQNNFSSPNTRDYDTLPDNAEAEPAKKSGYLDWDEVG